MPAPAVRADQPREASDGQRGSPPGSVAGVGYRVLGEAAMLLHFAFLCYVVLGGFLAWHRPGTALVHIPAALYGLGISLVGWVCPLTYVEDWARERAGRAGLTEAGFIEHYLGGVVYPEGRLHTLQLAAGAVVAFSYAGAAVSWRRRARRSASSSVSSRSE